MIRAVLLPVNVVMGELVVVMRHAWVRSLKAQSEVPACATTVCVILGRLFPI